MASFPMNIDDAFVEGWNFGRYGLPRNHHVMTRHNSTFAVRCEYERGVSDGYAFQTRCNAAASAEIVALMAQG